MTGNPSDLRAVRMFVGGVVQGVGFRDATRRRALQLGLAGWVRNSDDGRVAVHAEGKADAIEALLAFLRVGPRSAVVEGVEIEPARIEGHEQFAIRGVSAGVFVVREYADDGDSPRFELGLEVAGALRFWLLSRCPSLDPSVKRLAVEMPEPRRNAPASTELDGDEPRIWDSGPYEQGGRVPWPQALERGHAVFVLHGQRLRGGFVLQRTRLGDRPQWLLIKRRDEHAQPRPS